MGGFSLFQRQKQGSYTASPSSSFAPRHVFSPNPTPPIMPTDLTRTSSVETSPQPQFDFAQIPLFPSSTSPKKNNTGIPDPLKANVEYLAATSLDQVQVHYHSSKPAQVHALAYTQGSHIYVGPGQEKHLAHEVWHIIQQQQQRVKPTLLLREMKANDETTLEHEADKMGRKAERMQIPPERKEVYQSPTQFSFSEPVAQMTIEEDVKKLGLEKVWDIIIKSPTAVKLIQKADQKKIQVQSGGYHGRAMTTKPLGSQQIIVYLTPSDNILDDAQALIFELHNALRQDRFDALKEKVRNKEITDPDVYAREKIMIEIEGMVRTGGIGFELREADKETGPSKGFFMQDFLNYREQYKKNNDLTPKEFAKGYADEVLDRPHESGSHRKVYREQFVIEAPRAPTQPHFTFTPFSFSAVSPSLTFPKPTATPLPPTRQYEPTSMDQVYESMIRQLANIWGFVRIEARKENLEGWANRLQWFKDVGRKVVLLIDNARRRRPRTPEHLAYLNGLLNQLDVLTTQVLKENNELKDQYEKKYPK